MSLLGWPLMCETATDTPRARAYFTFFLSEDAIAFVKTVPPR